MVTDYPDAYSFAKETGAFLMPFDIAFQYFDSFEAVRHLDESWYFHEAWPCVADPWHLHVHETKFRFCVKKEGLHIIVVSQVRCMITEY